nr:hypothetical protein [Blastocatellia bacterium]
VSQCTNTIWTHNDSGGGPFIYSMGPNGKHLGAFRVESAKNIDWEDIAFHRSVTEDCFIYIGDIGNNDLVDRTGRIYRVAEPEIDSYSAASSKLKPQRTAPAEVLEFRYPDRPNDAEAMLVHPTSGDIYIVTKHVSGPSKVYKLKPEFNGGSVQTATEIAEIKLPSVPYGAVTGGDIAPDGRRLILVDYSAAYEFTLPTASLNFDEIWETQPVRFDVGKRPQGEGIAYLGNGEALIASSEGKHSAIWFVERIK